MWSLTGPDADQFTIDGGALSFREPPNYEDPRSAARGGRLAERNVYRVTIEASGGTHDVAVRVTDAEEAGTASMNRPQPQADRPFGASLSDEDEGVTYREVAVGEVRRPHDLDGRRGSDISEAESGAGRRGHVPACNSHLR